MGQRLKPTCLEPVPGSRRSPHTATLSSYCLRPEKACTATNAQHSQEQANKTRTDKCCQKLTRLKTSVGGAASILALNQHVSSVKVLVGLGPSYICKMTRLLIHKLFNPSKTILGHPLSAPPPYSFASQIFTEHLVCARHSTRSWKYNL